MWAYETECHVNRCVYLSWRRSPRLIKKATLINTQYLINHVLVRGTYNWSIN